MNGSDVDASAPRRWLDYAEEDLRAARLFQQRTDFAPRHACWCAQQASEKALKGLGLLERAQPKRTHRLDVVLTESVDMPVPAADLRHLTEAGVTGRYPDSDPAPTAEDAHRAVTVAGTIYDFVAAEFRRRGASG